MQWNEWVDPALQEVGGWLMPEVVGKSSYASAVLYMLPLFGSPYGLWLSQGLFKNKKRHSFYIAHTCCALVHAFSNM